MEIIVPIGNSFVLRHTLFVNEGGELSKLVAAEASDIVPTIINIFNSEAPKSKEVLFIGPKLYLQQFIDDLKEADSSIDIRVLVEEEEE